MFCSHTNLFLHRLPAFQIISTFFCLPLYSGLFRMPWNILPWMGSLWVYPRDCFFFLHSTNTRMQHISLLLMKYRFFAPFHSPPDPHSAIYYVLWMNLHRRVFFRRCAFLSRVVIVVVAVFGIFAIVHNSWKEHFYEALSDMHGHCWLFSLSLSLNFSFSLAFKSLFLFLLYAQFSIAIVNVVCVNQLICLQFTSKSV